MKEPQAAVLPPRTDDWLRTYLPLVRVSTCGSTKGGYSLHILAPGCREVNWTVSDVEAILAVNKGEMVVCGSSMFCLE